MAKEREVSRGETSRNIARLTSGLSAGPGRVRSGRAAGSSDLVGSRLGVVAAGLSVGLFGMGSAGLTACPVAFLDPLLSLL